MWGVFLNANHILMIFNDIPCHEPPLQASFSPVRRIRNWSIGELAPLGMFKLKKTQETENKQTTPDVLLQFILLSSIDIILQESI